MHLQKSSKAKELLKVINNPSNTRYIIYECLPQIECGGWADRLKGITLELNLF
jgi:hypothetical protein